MSRTRSGSMLKFSTSSVTSARASYARQRAEGPNWASAAPPGTSPNRKKFFNSSTELYHVFTQMLMSFCRRVTSTAHTRRRVLLYANLVLIGGLLKDFAPSLLRAFFFSLSPSHPFNLYFVKLAWAWDMLLLLPLVALSAQLVAPLQALHLDEVEKGIEEWVADRQQGPPPARVVSLESLSTSRQTHRAELEHTQWLLSLRPQQAVCAPLSATWLRLQAVRAGALLLSRDVLRLAVSSALYYASMCAFHWIQLTSRRPRLSPGGSALVAAESGSREGQSWLDISGHVFILVYSNLMLVEECGVMARWESLGDRLSGLGREFFTLQMSPQVFSVPSNRLLLTAWGQYRSRTSFLRLLFALSTSLTLLWDFMLLQTALFYHSLVEKLVALAWALSCWYLSYRVLFPGLGLPVRQVTSV